MTAHENLAFALKLRKPPRAEIERRVPERVHLFDADTGARIERESLA